MQDVDFTTLQAIREEAGMQQYKNGEVLEGVIDGSNKTFLTSYKPIVDINQDDILSPGDVVCYVDDAPVTVDSINPAAGALSLHSAPEADSVVSADYAFSPLSDADVEVYRTRAEKWLVRRVKNVFDMTTVTSNSFPEEWTNMVLLYAAGLILIKDYGSSVDTDGTSKDGYKKLGLARDLMKEYLMDLGEDSSASTLEAEQPNSTTDGNIFGRDSMLGRSDGRSRDDEFMRHEDRF